MPVVIATTRHNHWCPLTPTVTVTTLKIWCDSDSSCIVSLYQLIQRATALAADPYAYYGQLTVDKAFGRVARTGVNRSLLIVLYCLVLYCLVLYCLVLYCILLYWIELYCILYYIVLYWLSLQTWSAHDCLLCFQNPDTNDKHWHKYMIHDDTWWNSWLVHTARYMWHDAILFTQTIIV